jgi:nucleoside-diphosphate-sugar epimerase
MSANQQTCDGSSAADREPGGKVVVTGAAGFIGSTLVDRLLDLGFEVVGVDRRTPRADELVGRHLADALAEPRFTLVEADLAISDLDGIVADADVVFHLAAVPGVRTSWGERFPDYVSANLVGTFRLLAACEQVGVRRLVCASSSSVYGIGAQPSREMDPTRPISPYGVTKLAGEQLCLAHAARVDTTLSVVAVRYFTVYGPRQRPDMAISRMLVAALTGAQYTLFGDGSQQREFTFVDDVVEATIAASRRDVPSTVINVGGGSCVSIIDLCRMVREVTGNPVPLTAVEPCAGDVPATSADLTVASALLGYRPRTDLLTGMTRQVEWLRQLPPNLLQRFTPPKAGVQEVPAC